MLAAGAFALTLTDVAFLVPPPQAPGRNDRRRRSAGTLLRSIRRELALALSDHPDTWIPRITARYPY